MQTANIMLAIGGDKDNTVPKFHVTASEIAVLRFIHGDDSVTEIEPTGVVLIEGKPPTHRAERMRLLERYGKSVDGRFVSSAVEALFPGAAARVFETLDELEIPDDFYKAERRVSRNAPAKAPEPQPAAPTDVDLESMTKAQLVAYAKTHGIAIDAAAKKEDVLAAIVVARGAPDPVLPPPEPEPEGGEGEDADGIGEMDDKKNLFG